MQKSTTKEFINKAQKIHGDKYDYSLVEYIGSFSKVKIICKKHGEFIQMPNKHLCGRGCPKCGKRLSTEEFIKSVKKIHINKYDYSLVKYYDSFTKVKIICPIHGIFEQSPVNHSQGSGCQKCGQDKRTLPMTIHTIKKHIKILSEVGVEARLNNDNLEVKCYSCGKWHTQTIQNSRNKINSANGKLNGENNFYCSDECKNSCPVYRHNTKHVDPRSILYVDKTEREFARSCQTDILKQIQCETHGYNYCEKCGDIIDVELHHTLKVSEYGVNAISNSGHMLLCAGCHVELHNECKI